MDRGEASGAVLSTEEAVARLSGLGVAKPRLDGANPLPNGGVVLAAPRPGIVLREIPLPCAAALRKKATHNLLMTTRAHIDRLTSKPSAETLDALRVVLTQLSPEMNACAPGLHTAAAEVSAALSSWQAARQQHVESMRSMSRAKKAVRDAEGALRSAQRELDASSKKAEGAEEKTLRNLKRHWGPLRDAVSQALLLEEQLKN